MWTVLIGWTARQRLNAANQLWRSYDRDVVRALVVARYLAKVEQVRNGIREPSGFQLQSIEGDVLDAMETRVQTKLGFK